MSKIFAIVEDLRNCYESKYPFADDWAKASHSEKANLCESVRKSLVNYVNSPEYAFIDIAYTYKKELQGRLY